MKTLSKVVIAAASAGSLALVVILVTQSYPTHLQYATMAQCKSVMASAVRGGARITTSCRDNRNLFVVWNGSNRVAYYFEYTGRWRPGGGGTF